MFVSLPTTILIFFILGASFAFGLWSFVMFAAKFLPTPSLFRNSLATQPSAIESTKHLLLKKIELRDGKVYVLIFNSSPHTYTDFLFRITVRDEDGQLMEDLTSLAHGFARPQSEFDCILRPCGQLDRWKLSDSDNSIKVELINANTA